MSYKEFRRAGKVGLWMSDLAWAGRLYTKYPYWWKKLSFIVAGALALSVLSLIAIWLSILLRPPVLLLGVYPDARVVCMPRIMDEFGNPVQRHSSYNQICGTLFTKAGLLWVVEESKKTGGQMPSSDPAAEHEDAEPYMRVPTTSVDVLEIEMLEKQAERHREDVKTLSSQPPSR